MPFGLKNVGATYQWMMQVCFRDQIGRNVQVYIDKIVIKTYSAITLLDDLRETFATLNKYRIKLNPKKCVFGVPAGKLLGYMVSCNIPKILKFWNVNKLIIIMIVCFI